ncbi:MAG: amidohydrolase family protein, partial [Chloroflexi bacterium]|nr:amidohydrolase family protein [Chloroflexota bacterium]
MARDYRLMSSDGHLEVPPEHWVHRVPEKYRDRAPKTIELPGGGDALVIEGMPPREANFLDLRAGRATGQWQPFGLRVEDAAGVGPPEKRIREQDEDGLDAEVLFPAQVAGPSMWRNIKDDDAYKAMIRGYNDWLGKDYCPADPDRLIGMGIIPWTNVDDAVAELKHIAKLGLKGVVLGSFPNGKSYPMPE